MKKILILGAGFLALASLACSANAASPSSLNFCAGLAGGFYDKLASEIGRSITQNSGMPVSVLETGGSVMNAEKMQDKSCDIAIMQADVAMNLGLRDAEFTDAHTETVFWLHGAKGVDDFGKMEDDKNAKRFAVATVRGSGAAVTVNNWVKTDKDYEGVRVVEMEDWAEVAKAVSQGYVVRSGERFEIAGTLYIGRSVSTDISEDFGKSILVGEVNDDSFANAKDANANPLYSQCSVVKAQRSGLGTSTVTDPDTYCLTAQIVFNNDSLAGLDKDAAKKIRKAVAKGVNSTVKLVRQ